MSLAYNFEIGTGPAVDDIKALLQNIGVTEWTQIGSNWKTPMRASKMWCLIEALPPGKTLLAEGRPSDVNFEPVLRVSFHRHSSNRAESAQEIKDFAEGLVRIGPVPFVLSIQFEELLMYRHRGGELVVCDHESQL